MKIPSFGQAISGIAVWILIFNGISLAINAVISPKPGEQITVRGEYPGTFTATGIKHEWGIITLDTIVSANFVQDPGCVLQAESRHMMVFLCYGQTYHLVPKVVNLAKWMFTSAVIVPGNNNSEATLIDLNFSVDEISEDEAVIVIDTLGRTCLPDKNRAGAFSITLQVYCWDSQMIYLAEFQVPVGYNIVDATVK